MHADVIPTQKDSQQIAGVYKKVNLMPVLWFQFDFASKMPQMETGTGFITNGKSLKAIVGEYEEEVATHWFSTSWSELVHSTS
jgi:hypothetical protein